MIEGISMYQIWPFMETRESFFLRGELGPVFVRTLHIPGLISKSMKSHDNVR